MRQSDGHGDRQDGGSDRFAALWHQLRHPGLLIAGSGLALALVVVSRLLPQLPGQILGDPATETRWLLMTSREYGLLGEVWRGIGLFDVLHSLLLRVLLAAIALLLLVHLADLIDVGLRLQRLPAQVQRAPLLPGEPVGVPGSGPVVRLRDTFPLPPEQALSRLRDLWQGRYGEPRGLAVDLPEGAGHEQRLLAVQHRWAAYIRPFFPAGALLVLVVVWLSIVWGWQVAPPPLAPEGEFRYPPRDLALHYQVNGQDSGPLSPRLTVTLDDRTGSLAVVQTSYLRLGGAGVWVHSGPPGLLISTGDGSQAIARPGQDDPMAAAGLLFQAPGSEEILLLPRAETGLRLVRLAGAAPAFLVEVFHTGSVQPVTRLEIRQDQVVAVPVPQGELPLRFALLSGLTVQVRAMPGDWLLGPALALMAVGAAGFLRRPRFVLAQLAPWPVERTVLVLQSDAEAQIEAIWSGMVEIAEVG